MKTTVLLSVILVASLASVSAHVVKGLISPELATAFVSSPSVGGDLPVLLKWGSQPSGETGLRVICFNAANTSEPRLDRPAWPRVTAVGFELPGAPTGFALVAPLDGGWDLVEGVEASLPNHGDVTLDVAIFARVDPWWWIPGRHRDPRGIPPGQQGVRGSGTRFCVSGPFPDVLPDFSTPNPDDTVATTIEFLIDGVVVGFEGVNGNPGGFDAGVWFPNPPGNAPRVIPLYPD
jgi:hypothetical protein